MLVVFVRQKAFGFLLVVVRATLFPLQKIRDSNTKPVVFGPVCGELLFRLLLTTDTTRGNEISTEIG